MKQPFLFVITDAVLVSLITGVFSLAGVIITLLLKTRIDRYHAEVNGMKGELVDAVKGKGEAEGNLKGRLEQTEENNKKIEISKI